MSASGGKGALALATRQLLANWERTRESWSDQKALEFESDYLSELASTVNSAMKAMEDLDKLLEKIHADCE